MRDEDDRQPALAAGRDARERVGSRGPAGDAPPPGPPAAGIALERPQRGQRRGTRARPAAQRCGQPGRGVRREAPAVGRAATVGLEPGVGCADGRQAVADPDGGLPLAGARRARGAARRARRRPPRSRPRPARSPRGRGRSRELPEDGRGGPLARAHRAVHVAAPARGGLGCRPSGDGRPARAGPCRSAVQRAGREVAAVAAARPLLVGPRLARGRRSGARRAAEQPANPSTTASRRRRRPWRPARGRRRPRGSPAARRGVAGRRRVVEDDPRRAARSSAWPAEALGPPERLVVDGHALRHRALRHALDELVARRGQRRRVGDAGR